jgi:hypothetical protein
MAERQPNLESVVDMLAMLARDKVYGPLDMLSRVEDNDEFYMKLAREALYSAMRYISTDKQLRIPNLDESVEFALRLIERRPHVAKELALKALARAMSAKGEEEGDEKAQ